MIGANPEGDLAAVTAWLREVVAASQTEEDLRIGVEKLLSHVVKDLPTASYEKRVKTTKYEGRADAVHHRLVLEYERPGGMARKAQRDHAVQQVCDYLTGITLGPSARVQPHDQPPEFAYEPEEEERLAGNVGIALDGERFVFVQRRSRRWFTQDRNLDGDAVETLLLWLTAMIRKDLSPENLIRDFGPTSATAAEVVGALARLVLSEAHPKANVIFREWRRLFGMVYGAEQLERGTDSAEARALKTAYQLELGAAFPVILFAVHTYYALLMKLLATEVIVAQGSYGGSFLGTLSRGELKAQLSDLESGKVLDRQGIRNAIEQDFFGWYPEAWTEELHAALWRFCDRLKEYDVGTVEIRPDRARDLLKDLYHGLIPATVRHALGEYYTPDWLAEHTLDIAGYDGDPSKSLLDPACGSGTFLVMALKRIRQWLTDRTIEWGTREKKIEAVKLILKNLVGFDLNPLAVIAARTNYLFALGPLLNYRATDFELPVFLTDSVLLPGGEASKGAFTLGSQDTTSFPMTVGSFEIPNEVIAARKVPELMNFLHDSVADGRSRNSFVERSVTSLQLSDSDNVKKALRNLFETMAYLDGQGKNRVWAKLIRNRYASLFYRQAFDFIVGNPPHVNFESLTPEWRNAAKGAYTKYGMYNLKGLDARHGGGKKDIAALFTYAVIDHFLKDGGTIALIVHVSLFKTSAGEGFRKFRLGVGAPFRVEVAHDFASFQPFQTHPAMKIKTRTLSFRAIKGQPTKYPIPYHVWTKTTRGNIPGNLTWEQAKVRLASEQREARPLRGTGKSEVLSPWLTISKEQYRRIKKVIAPPQYVPNYQGRAGVFTGGLNGVYFVKILEQLPNGAILIENLHDVGKIKVPSERTLVEADLVHPLVRGRSISRWGYHTMDHILVVQNPETMKGYEVGWMQVTHPLTWGYLKRFEAKLKGRPAFKKFFKPGTDPFYSMYAVSKHTFAPYKVAWMDISATVKATAVIVNEGEIMPILEHKVLFLTTESADEAYYVTAVLNSEQANTVITGYIVDNSVSTHPIENVIIPKYDPTDANHAHLVALSRAAHAAHSGADGKALKEHEREINRVADRLW